MRRSMLEQLKKEGYEDSTGAGSPIDVTKYHKLLLTCRVGDIRGTNARLDVKVQHSMDGEHWNDLFTNSRQGLFPRITDSGIYSIVVTNFGSLIRVYWILRGQNASVNFKVDGFLQGECSVDEYNMLENLRL